MANAAVVYDRDINDSTYSFEASGGLVHATLIMRDLETDSYWSIMTHQAIHGALKGKKLSELAVGKKMKWKDWKFNHPNSLVLSVKGQEDTKNVYSNYFNNDGVFRGNYTDDKRLLDKEPIFAFEFNQKKYAIPHGRIEGGKIINLEDKFFFMYRPKNSAVYQSTAAYKLEDLQLEIKNSKWLISGTNCYFNSKAYRFVGEEEECPTLIFGLDTFWYTWSLTNPGTIILY